MTPAVAGALVLAFDLGLIAFAGLLVLRGLFAWLRAAPRHRLVGAAAGVTEPVLSRLRALLPSALRDFPVDVAYLAAIGVTLFARYAVLAALGRADGH